MTSPSVSVVLCTRNGARHLREQLASIGSGSTQPDEVIVLDDDSEDDTVAVAEEWARGRSLGTVRIEVNRPPLGVTRNFERGIRLATGAVIVLSDQDDRWHPDRLEAALQTLDAEGALLEHGDARLVDDLGDPIGGTLFDYLRLSARERRAEELGRGFDVLLRRNTVTGATAAFRAELCRSALPIPDGWVHDEWLAVIAAARRGLVLDDGIRVDYRLHSANAIGADRPTMRHLVTRAIGREPGRPERLATRARQLVARLQEIDAPDAVLAAATGKARFESARAAMPDVRILRIPTVVRLLASGDYGRYASRGRWDVVRDLLQPRGDHTGS